MIVVVPADKPVTKPVRDPILATVVLLLLHNPTGVASLNVVVPPVQSMVVPVIAAGFACTFITTVVIQPVANVYVMVVDPVEMPVTTPELIPIVAIVVLPLVHVPPPSEARVTVCPIHTLLLPTIFDGSGFTVTIILAAQPVLNV